MPIMDGIEASKRIKKMMFDNVIQQVPIVGLTSFNSA